MPETRIKLLSNKADIAHRIATRLLTEPHQEAKSATDVPNVLHPDETDAVEEQLAWESNEQKI